MSQVTWPRTTPKVILPLLTACIWALAAASVVFWFLQWPKAQNVSTVSVPVAKSLPIQDATDQVARALGHLVEPAAGQAVQANSQYKLQGVIVSPSGQGTALIATDGQASKAYRVGQAIQEGVTLVSLTARQARLKSSSGEVLLELPVVDKP